jgi:hypothetical protein
MNNNNDTKRFMSKQSFLNPNFNKRDSKGVSKSLFSAQSNLSISQYFNDNQPTDQL